MLIIFSLAFAFNYLISCQENVLTPMCLPCLLWITLIHLNLPSVLLNMGRVMIPLVGILHSNAKP